MDYRDRETQMTVWIYNQQCQHLIFWVWINHPVPTIDIWSFHHSSPSLILCDHENPTLLPHLSKTKISLKCDSTLSAVITISTTLCNMTLVATRSRWRWPHGLWLGSVGGDITTIWYFAPLSKSGCTLMMTSFRLIRVSIFQKVNYNKRRQTEESKC